MPVAVAANLPVRRILQRKRRRVIPRRVRHADAVDVAFDNAPLLHGAEFHIGSIEMSGVEQQPAFEDLARELAQPIMRYLERYVGDRALAQDLWQETLMRMHQGLPSFACRSSIKTWAFSIASRVAADY